MDARGYVSSVVERVLKAGGFPQETIPDSMAIVRVCYRPNNLRRQIRSDSTLKSAIPGLVRRGKLGFVRRGRVLLQVGRHVITAIWDQRVGGQKEVFRFEGSVAEVSGGIVEVRERIRGELDRELGWAAGFAGIPGDAPILWERAEEGISGDEFIDGLPRDLVVRSKVFQKVYAREGEFLSGKGEEPSIKAINYISNRALERIAPQVAEELAALRYEINPLRRVQERVRVFPDDLLRLDVQALLGGLTAAEKVLLTEWCFERFGKTKMEPLNGGI